MARPFDVTITNREHYLRIESLLKELLILLGRLPFWMIGDLNVAAAAASLSLPPSPQPQPQPQPSADVRRAQPQPFCTRRISPYEQELREEQDRAQRIAFRERWQRERAELREREQQQQRGQQQRREQQQQQLLPDLVACCGPSPRPPPPPPPPSSPPQQQPQHLSAENDDDDKFVNAVKLQVAVCPACYYAKERKLKVIAVIEMDMNNTHTHRHNNHCNDREQTVIVENNSSTVKQRLMSLFQPSKIESSMLTAMFVIIGWKMFIKQ